MTARISLTPPPTSFSRLATWYSRRRYGALLAPGLAMSHHPRLLRSYVVWESLVERWHVLPNRLKLLAVMATGHRLNCSWCTDYGYWVAHGQGIDEPTLRDVPPWRNSTRFTPLERDVMAYAEGMSGEPDEVDDELVARLRTHLGEAGFVELTMMVAVENQRSRFNRALGLTSQGFADRCAMPQPAGGSPT